ncbi:hypothetical protein KNJ79_02115 [Sphingopyxis indica]|uniref:hypothetical protein n=1 Tax=Sphingopyxis indica TaxID=436663 RepID=UPI002939342D|nr:hypothetical protein [Sphingopyxis indica]WOF43781.1 hypothetical protein KNJ79_02115 [Sphingopyxis indica]
MVKLHTFDATEAVGERLRLQVSVRRSFFLRTRIAVLIIRLAAFVCPLAVDIVEAQDEARA